MAASPKKTAAAKPTAAKAPLPIGSNYPVIKDKGIIAAAAEYARMDAQEKMAADRKKALKPILEIALGDAPTASAGTHIITKSVVAELPATPNVQITREMIGQVIQGKKARSGYTTISVR